MEIQKLLPKTSFVPFKARRLNSANVVYVNLPLFHEYGYFKKFTECSNDLYEEVLDYFGYIVPNSEADYELVDNVEREFLAERYGGAGILSNGGGARCGLVGPFSIKGVGPAPVVGQDVDFWYSHGRMGLAEALTELFYSHVAEIALPFPSSRVLAVIDTGGTILQRTYKKLPNSHEDECRVVPGGIIVRESGIRPAHFSRAFYFKPNEYMKTQHVHDYVRVKNVIPFLPSALHINNLNIEPNHKYLQAIDRILANSAIQLAYSKVRRVMHGSLGSSNILVNGGWIDFGSATVVPSYAQLITAELQPPFWDEMALFQKTTADLCFYVVKYQPQARAVLGGGMELYQKFVELYIQRLRVLFVELTGMPLIFAQEFINADWYERLGSMLLHIAHNESPRPHISNWVLHCESPAHQWPSHSLRSVMQKLFHRYWIEQSEYLPDLPFKSDFTASLWHAYKMLCESIKLSAGKLKIRQESLVRFIAYSMVKQLSGVKPLYRGHMLRAIENELGESVSKEELRDRIAKMYKEYDCLSLLHYATCVSNDLLLSTSGDLSLYWDLARCQYRLEISQKFIASSEEGFGVESFQVMLGNNYLPFSVNVNSKGNFRLYYFDPCSLGNDKEFENIQIINHASFTIFDVFPQLRSLYHNFVVAIAGLEIPAENICD